MTVLVDANVLLDVLDARHPWADDGFRVWGLAETGAIDGVVCAISPTTVSYLFRKRLNHKEAIHNITRIVRSFRIAGVTESHVTRAAVEEVVDFEDAVQAYSGIDAGATHVVTRNASDFQSLPIIAIDVPELIKLSAGS